MSLGSGASWVPVPDHLTRATVPLCDRATARPYDRAAHYPRRATQGITDTSDGISASRRLGIPKLIPTRA